MTWLSSALRSSTKKTTIQVLLPRLSLLRSEELFTSWAGVPKETAHHRKSALSPSRSPGHRQVYRRQCCFTSTIKQGTSSIVHRSLSSSTEARAPKKAEVEIISKENIKPASLTPHHLRKYKLSGLDQLFPHLYAPLVFYYPNSEKAASEDVIHERSQRLKQSLSETLTRFYPFAGRIKDELHIECNDDGVYYVQTRVNDRLSDFLSQPDNKLIHKLLPYDPNSLSSNSETYLVMVQVNFFDCGGVAISLCTSHKLIDGHTYAVFLKAWTETARGSLEKIYPSFIAPSLFPQNPSLAKGSSIVMLPSKHKKSKCVTRRIRFNASAISALKEKVEPAVQNPSRVVTVASFIWKCATAASRAKGGSVKPSILSLAVNLRNRCSPPLPQYTIGNNVWGAVAFSLPDSELELHSMVAGLKDGIAKVNSDFVDEIKGKEGLLKLAESIKQFGEMHSNAGADYYAVTSVCNGGLYDADFGWGKPIWISIGNGSADLPMLTNVIFLMDTPSGYGVEAWVTLSEEDMAILECDPELLSSASLDPCPLLS